MEKKEEIFIENFYSQPVSAIVVGIKSRKIEKCYSS